MTDEKREIIYHFMFPFKTPKMNEGAPGIIRMVPVDDDGEPIEDDEKYGGYDALTQEQWLKVAEYHEERGNYHQALANLAKTKAATAVRVQPELFAQSSDEPQ